MGDDDLIRRGDAARAVALCSAESDSPNAHFVCRQAVNAIAALPAVSAPHPYSLRPDLQKIVDNAKNAPQWDTERDRLSPAVLAAIAALPAVTAPQGVDALVKRLCVAAQDMVTVARQDGWAEATTGRQIILRAVQDALAAYRGEAK